QLIRAILDSSDQDLISLEEEREMLSRYLELEALRFGGAMNFSVEIDSSLDVNTIGIPPMLLQPIVENAVRHGLGPLQGRGQVVVQFDRSAHRLCIRIQDNGVGREFHQVHRHNRNMYGIALTENRLASLTQQHGQPFSFQITDLFAPDKQVTGTRVDFELPILQLK
ncbi:MAG: hypothetical protein AAF570_19885, partial [Bacteroidota bacterium]